MISTIPTLPHPSTPDPDHTRLARKGYAWGKWGKGSIGYPHRCLPRPSHTFPVSGTHTLIPSLICLILSLLAQGRLIKGRTMRENRAPGSEKGTGGGERREEGPRYGPGSQYQGAIKVN